MTKRNFKTLWAGALIVLFTAMASPSQAEQISAKVPFSFTVSNGTALPPGDYTLSTDGQTVLVRGASRAAFSIAQRVESRGDGDAKLVFHKYGDTYILRKVWLGGGIGRDLPSPRLERELMERKVTGSPEHVTVAGR